MTIADLPGRLQRRVGDTILDLRYKALQGRLRVDPTRALLLFASPRGGSTWLEEMVAQMPGTATLWEPLDIVRVPPFRRIGFWLRQHIPEHERWPEAEALFQDLFSGRMLSLFLARTTGVERLRNADRLLVKFVRGNLLLPWITTRFKLPPPVLLIRHPCAVVASQLTWNAWRLPRPGAQWPPPHRYDEHVRGLMERIGPIHDHTDLMAALWCIGHAHVLSHPGNDRAWTTITYEELITRTEATLTKVFTAWGEPVPLAALEQARKPSRTTKEKDKSHDPRQQLERWRTSLSSDQQHRILTMVERCGITLYNNEVMPTVNYTP